ncbi:MAG: dihydroneopterin aldolase [Pseudomonadota bacterium]
MSDMDLTTIFIHGLEIEMSVGIHAFEKTKKQRVIIDIEVECKAQKIENLDDTIDYETISNNVKAHASSQHFDLVETFADDVAALCLKEKTAISVEVAVSKPDIIDDVDAVGVRVFRTEC